MTYIRIPHSLYVVVEYFGINVCNESAYSVIRITLIRYTSKEPRKNGG